MCLENPKVDMPLLSAIGDYDILQKQSENYGPLRDLGALRIEPTAKPHTYTVSLTELGTQAMERQPYGHRTTKFCDASQVSLNVAKFDHVEVTGVSQDGVAATVEAQYCYKPTEFGIKFLAQPEDILMNRFQRRLSELVWKLTVFTALAKYTNFVNMMTGGESNKQ
jgi:hypothetical protein